ncbi:putative glycoside hydrolase family 24 [Lyophyllum shimeji]|uniref:Glycoside hydrolase family 24 n=1 Tax=Lyophyllum shimeji TaxID=47721 RepID=A0A9P3PZU4_LYOSH|nr:putative glycoside hydrolase family 24 [Lyophyllum shimeji]
MIVLPTVLLLVAHLVKGTPLAYQDSGALAIRQSDDGAVGDFFDFDGSSFDTPSAVDNPDSPAFATADAAVTPDAEAASIGARSACPAGINAATVNLIKSFEGFVPRPAPDPIGLPTVGFGHRCKTKGCAEVPFKFPLTQSTASQLLQSDVKPFVACINGAVSRKVVLNDNQLGALTSWSFNVGCGAAKSSTLVKRLNAGQNPNTVAAQELPRWNKAGGKVLAGLTRRRAAEVKLFQTPSKVKAHPC